MFSSNRRAVCLLLLIIVWAPCRQACAQEESLEQRQPLELVFADSIVPQDRHEAMFTTGLWYFRRGSVNHGLLTQKVEWGISDRLQVSTFVELLNSSNESGPRKTGIGDFEIGARYSWARVGSEFTHVALAFDAGFPTGNVQRGLSEGAYTLAPSILVSRELGRGKYQIFTTTGLDFVVKRRRLDPTREGPRNSFFSNSGVTVHAGHGWLVSEVSVTSNGSGHGRETHLTVTPSYVWRLQRRTELLFGIPIGVTSSTDRVGAVIKFTFELGGKPE
jgi:Putative MetA-pathway of phenol degradation